jgi:hypothetical protein
MSTGYQVTVERDYIAYADTEEEAMEKVKIHLKGSGSRVVKAIVAPAMVNTPIIDNLPAAIRANKAPNAK